MRLQSVECSPIDWLCVLYAAHDVSNSDGLLADHYGELVSVLKLLLKDAIHSILEDGFVIFVTKDYV